MIQYFSRNILVLVSPLQKSAFRGSRPKAPYPMPHMIQEPSSSIQHGKALDRRSAVTRNQHSAHHSLPSSDSACFDFRFSFFSLFFRFRSALCSGVSSSCLLRFFVSPFSCDGSAAAAISTASAAVALGGIGGASRTSFLDVFSAFG